MPSIRSLFLKPTEIKKATASIKRPHYKRENETNKKFLNSDILQDKKMTKTIKLLCVILTCSYATGLELDASKSTHSINIFNIFLIYFEIWSGNTLQLAIAILSLSMT